MSEVNSKPVDNFMRDWRRVLTSIVQNPCTYLLIWFLFVDGIILKLAIPFVVLLVLLARQQKTKAPIKSNNDTKIAPPLAFLLFSFGYYFLTTSLTSAVSGISMASVEGVAIAPPWIDKFVAISPVFVYLIAWSIHAYYELRNKNTVAVRYATQVTFIAHLVWFAVCVILWVSCGAMPIFSFSKTVVGSLMFATGDYLAAILLAIFMWTWVSKMAVDERVSKESIVFVKRVAQPSP